MILYAEKYSSKVKALAPTSTVISGKLDKQLHDTEYYDNWKKTGWRSEKSTSRKGLNKRLKWSHMTDRLSYDVLPESDKLIMPTLLIVGDKDNRTPLKYQQLLYERLPGQKELHIIKDAPHTFKDAVHLAEIQNILSDWIEKVEAI